MEELNFYPWHVKAIESETKKTILENCSEFSYSVCELFVKKANDYKTDREAQEWIKRYLEIEEHDVLTLFLDIQGALQKSGFLPKALDLNSAREQMKMATVSPNVGSEEKS